jgi:hypothetical protein
VELGVLSATDADELFTAGFLRADDEFWTDQDPMRRPLSERASPAPQKDTSWLVRAADSVVAAGGVVRQQASHVANKLSAVVVRNKTSVAAATNRVLEDYLPALRLQVARKLNESVQTTGAALRDEGFLRKLFGAVYDCLPKPVRRFVQEGPFIEFCLKHRRKLLD